MLLDMLLERVWVLRSSMLEDLWSCVGEKRIRSCNRIGMYESAVY